LDVGGKLCKFVAPTVFCHKVGLLSEIVFSRLSIAQNQQFCHNYFSERSKSQRGSIRSSPDARDGVVCATAEGLNEVRILSRSQPVALESLPLVLIIRCGFMGNYFSCERKCR